MEAIYYKGDSETLMNIFFLGRGKWGIKAAFGDLLFVTRSITMCCWVGKTPDPGHEPGYTGCMKFVVSQASAAPCFSFVGVVLHQNEPVSSPKRLPALSRIARTSWAGCARTRTLVVWPGRVFLVRATGERFSPLPNAATNVNVNVVRHHQVHVHVSSP